ncbi:hypothetical protein [Dactylosporangium sp. CA-233914]|uniref:hypothetical protein n=1 Tax=Dactylosporangium sp. CA-233914 TaxID=3239934 RepID=UPI003D915D2B
MVPLEHAIEVARVLENVVISLDRIGSREACGDADVHTFDQFLKEWWVGPRLSHVRVLMWEAIANAIGAEAVEEIAEAVPRFPDPVPEEVRRFVAERNARWAAYDESP